MQGCAQVVVVLFWGWFIFGFLFGGCSGGSSSSSSDNSRPSVGGDPDLQKEGDVKVVDHYQDGHGNTVFVVDQVVRKREDYEGEQRVRQAEFRWDEKLNLRGTDSQLHLTVGYDYITSMTPRSIKDTPTSFSRYFSRDTTNNYRLDLDASGESIKGSKEKALRKFREDHKGEQKIKLARSDEAYCSRNPNVRSLAAIILRRGVKYEFSLRGGPGRTDPVGRFTGYNDLKELGAYWNVEWAKAWDGFQVEGLDEP